MFFYWQSERLTIPQQLAYQTVELIQLCVDNRPGGVACGRSGALDIVTIASAGARKAQAKSWP